MLPNISIEKAQLLKQKLEEIIPIINEATAKARQDYEIKQAQLLQKEMMNLM